MRSLRNEGEEVVLAIGIITCAWYSCRLVYIFCPLFPTYNLQLCGHVEDCDGHLTVSITGFNNSSNWIQNETAANFLLRFACKYSPALDN